MPARSPGCQRRYAGNHTALEPVRLVPLALEPPRLAYEAAQLGTIPPTESLSRKVSARFPQDGGPRHQQQHRDQYRFAVHVHARIHGASRHRALRTGQRLRQRLRDELTESQVGEGWISSQARR